MPPSKRDLGCLWDMLKSAREARQYTEELTFHDFLSNRMLQLAVERLVEIIGEAARGVSDDFKNAHPEIPWSKIIAQRNVIVHEYGDIKQERIWDVVTRSIPELVELLSPHLPKDM